MKTYYDVLAGKEVEMRRARIPNPIERSSEGTWVVVMGGHGGEKLRFLVDDVDYERFVEPYRWSSASLTGDRIYTSARVPTGSGNSTVLLHRWLLDPPANAEVDHVDQNPLNNRRNNLRVVTRKQNEENKGRKKAGTSRHRGVWFDKTNQRWRAQVTHNYVAHKSPRFSVEQDAADWARDKRLELFSHNEEDK